MLRAVESKQDIDILGGPSRTRTCNQTVMSGRLSTGLVDFSVFLLEFDRALGPFALFLGRNWCGPNSDPPCARIVAFTDPMATAKDGAPDRSPQRFQGLFTTVRVNRHGQDTDSIFARVAMSSTTPSLRTALRQHVGGVRCASASQFPPTPPRRIRRFVDLDRLQ